MARAIKLEFKQRDIRLKDVPKYYQTLTENKVSVGFHKDVGIRILTKAVNTEFGGLIYFSPHKHYVTAPPRPIVRMYLYPEMKEKITQEFQKAINDEMGRGIKTPKTNAKNSLKHVGEECVYMQKEKVFIRGFDNSTNDTPFDPDYNGEEIVDYKGFDQPWIGKTGKTIEAINYKVRARD